VTVEERALNDDSALKQKEMETIMRNDRSSVTQDARNESAANIEDLSVNENQQTKFSPLANGPNDTLANED
jgi:hypothetical protein